MTLMAVGTAGVPVTELAKEWLKLYVMHLVQVSNTRVGYPVALG